MIRSIVHPTDLSDEGEPAFEHALRLAVACRCRLDLLHVHRPGGPGDWDSFPHVRAVLERWGFLEPGARVEDIAPTTGISIRKVQIGDIDAVDGLARFLETHHADLIVMRSHGRVGLERLLSQSVSFELAWQSAIPTLILGPESKPFVNSRTGEIGLGKVLVPVDHDPNPGAAILHLESLLDGLGAELDFLHVGDEAPRLRGAGRIQPPVRTMAGPVVETLLEEACGATLIAMPTAGRKGFRDALRGSTTERVINEAPCPVLAISAAGIPI